MILRANLGQLEPAGRGLSEARLRAAEEYLASIGVDPMHILTNDVGHRFPLPRRGVCDRSANPLQCDERNIRIEPDIVVPAGYVPGF